MLKSFKCPQCGMCFNRASQLDYHHRRLHLQEKSQICHICQKAFFRKADLRTHLNIHMGINFHICETCGRRFNHLSNLLRHCRIHTGLKYSCVYCNKYYTQGSSLMRHQRLVHQADILKKKGKCDSSLEENEQLNAKGQCHCESSGKNSKCVVCSNSFLQQYENYRFESISTLPESNSHKKIINNSIENGSYIEQKYQNAIRDPNVRKNETVPNHSVNMDNKVCSSLSQTDNYIASKEFEESNLGCKNAHQFSQDDFAEIEERLKTVVLNPLQDAVNNHEQIQAKDDIIYLHQSDKNNFIFLPQEKGLNVTLEAENYENVCFQNDSHITQETCKEISSNDIKTANTETNLQACNSNDASADQKLLYKQLCKDTVSDNKKCGKPSNDDVIQLYIELINSGMLKFDESKYCNNTDLDNINLNYTVKSQNSTSIETDKDTACTATITQNQDASLHNGENLDSLNTTNDVILNNDKPMLRLVQTETGEQFYEFIISNLVEDMQNISCTDQLETEVEESINTYQKLDSNLKESNEKNDQMEHQQALENFVGISNGFNYTQFDFHGEEKNFTILCHDESECIQPNSRSNIYDNNEEEKDTQNYNTEHLELLESESHVDFDKYVETNLEAFDRLNYENCNEKFLEFVEVADIGIENSGCKEPSMVRLIQNDGEQLLELLQDSQITEQTTNQDFVQANDFDKECSNILQNGNDKTIDYSKSKSDFFTYVENNASLEESVNTKQNIENNNKHVESTDNSLRNITIDKSTSNKNKTSERSNDVKTSERLKKPKIISQKFQCSVCKKTFSSAYNYKQHIGIHFTDQQKFHCKECGMSFAWKTTFNKHIASHSSETLQKFVCEICPKVYRTSSQVNEHVKRDHLKQRNYVCPECGKSFFKKSDLKTHNRIHTDERPYMCRECGKHFHHQSHIIRHMRTHSGKSVIFK